MKGFPGVVGAIDETCVPIKAPIENRNDCINRKFFHSVQFENQICQFQLKIVMTFHTKYTRGGGGAHKHLFDKHARPRTSFNYPKIAKNRMPQNSNPKNTMTQDAMFFKV